MHIVWVNDHADFTGGCETYIYQTVSMFNEMGVQSTLLYDINAPISPDFTDIFCGCFPMVDINIQTEELQADLIFIHAIEDINNLKLFTKLATPTIRFFHDQKPFCLREHKYTTIGHETCNQKLGMKCYSCLGFINKSENLFGFKFKSLEEKQAALEVNQQLDQFVVGSEYMVKQLIQHGFPVEKITKATLFSPKDTKKTPVQVLKFAPSEIVEQAATIDHQILFVGQLVRGKGLDTLLDAMTNVSPEISLVICGKGSMEQDYKVQAKQNGLNSRVHFMGQLPAEQISHYYRTSAAVVIPARAPETFCLVGLEALKSGVPVIATNVGGMGEWLKPNINSLSFEVNNPKQLALRINALVHSKDLQTELRHNIAHDNYDKFSPDQHIESLSNLFTYMVEAS